MAIFKEAKKYGSERGIPALMTMSVLDAPSDSNTSINSRSVAATPAATLTVIGKNDSTNAVMTAGTVPIPNHSTSTGTTATLGTELKATSSGLRQRLRKSEEPTSTPSAIPNTTEMQNPRSVVINVCCAFGQIRSQSLMSVRTVLEGVGSTNSGMLKTLQNNSHTTKNSNAVAAGSTKLRSLLVMLMGCDSWRTRFSHAAAEPCRRMSARNGRAAFADAIFSQAAYGSLCPAGRRGRGRNRRDRRLPSGHA